MMLFGLEIIMFLATILFVILWIWNPGGYYEPWKNGKEYSIFIFRQILRRCG